MRIASLFAGVGGLELGLEWAGLGSVVLQVERDAFCRSVLARHWPGVVRVGNVKLFGKDRWGSRRVEWPEFDLLCGGYPCQGMSSAGKGEGFADSRSGLWREFSRIISEFHPKWVVVENVASGAKRWVDAVVCELGQLGYEALPLPIAAEDVGAPHRRARVFVVARRVSDAECGPVREQSRGSRGPSRGAARLAGLVGEEVDDTSGVGLDARWHQHTQGEPERGRRQELGGGCEAVGDSRNSRLEEPAEQLARSELQTSERAGIGSAEGSLANNNKMRLEEIGSGGLPDAEPPFGHDADGRSGPRPWPPGPGDLDGWADWIGAGGPQPSLRRGVDGLPCGMARREWERQLKAYGNAVVPQCAEVVGWVIRELAEF